MDRLRSRLLLGLLVFTPSCSEPFHSADSASASGGGISNGGVAVSAGVPSSDGVAPAQHPINEGADSGGLVAGSSGSENGSADSTLSIAYTGVGATKGLNATEGTHSLGRQFEVTAEGVSVVDLGAWDFGADGLAAPHVVTLFALNKLGAGASGKPVTGASVTVPEGTVPPLEGGFRFAALAAPVNLPPGPYAVVVYGMNGPDPYGDGGSLPAARSGIGDARFDCSDSAPIQSPTYPTNGDSNNHTSASFRYQSRATRITRILPLGDSLTEGQGSSGGYRRPLAALLADAQPYFQFVGSVVTNPGTLDPDQVHHEGHADLLLSAALGKQSLVDKLALYLGPAAAAPDVILLLAGTDDLAIGNFVDQAPARLEAIVSAISNRLTGYAPNARLIVAQVPPINDPNLDTQAVSYNAAVASLVAAHQAEGENVALVDMHGVLGAADFFDLVHPNDRGYRNIASVWLNGILAR